MNKDNQDLKAIQSTKAVYQKKLDMLKECNAPLEEIRKVENTINHLTELELQKVEESL